MKNVIQILGLTLLILSVELVIQIIEIVFPMQVFRKGPFARYKLLFPITGQFPIILQIQSFFNKSLQILNKKYTISKKIPRKAILTTIKLKIYCWIKKVFSFLIKQIPKNYLIRPTWFDLDALITFNQKIYYQKRIHL